MSKADTLIEELQAALPGLSPKLRRICHHALDAPVPFVRASSRELCDALGTSEPTLIRFCQMFGHSGLSQFRIDLALAMATRGGIAHGPDRKAVTVPDMPAQRDLARTLLPHLEGAHSLLLDTGATLEALAGELHAAAPRTIMTTGLGETQILLRQGVHEVLLPGGRLHAESGALAGQIAERTLADMHFDLCILAADRLDPGFGLSTFHEADAELKRRMMAASARLIVLADQSDFGPPSLHRIARPEQIDLLVTTLPEHAPALSQLRAAGIRVLTTAGKTGTTDGSDKEMR